MIYFDNGATSFPKPPSVTSEVMRCMTEYGGNPGRSGHRLSMEAAESVFKCRELICDLFGGTDLSRVFFGMNTTCVLNTVIKGCIKDGDHVLISDLEHNSVYRPIYKLASQGKITYSVFSTVSNGKRRSDVEILGGIEELIRKETKMLVCAISSNICSITLPIEKIGALCRRKNIIFVVDGAQGAGHEHIDVQKMNIDALCIPAHKGLYGPQGCGFGLLGDRILPDTLMEGGNGADSLLGEMSEELPERLEVGTLPTPAIAGLIKGIEYVKKRGIDSIAEKEKALFRRGREHIGNIRGTRIYLPENDGAVLLFNVEGMHSEQVAAELDKRGICVRGGYHCTALGHRTLGTEEIGGVRVSFGSFNTPKEVDILTAAVREIAKK